MKHGNGRFSTLVIGFGVGALGFGLLGSIWVSCAAQAKSTRSPTPAEGQAGRAGQASQVGRGNDKVSSPSNRVGPPREGHASTGAPHKFNSNSGPAVESKQSATEAGPVDAEYKELCRKACASLDQCSDAFADIVGQNMPPKALPILREQFKKQFADRSKCRASCEHSKQRESDRAAITHCLSKRDCHGFAQCILAEAEKQGKRKNKSAPGKAAGSSPPPAPRP